MGRRSVVIIGAGIAGLTTGYNLQKAGFDVTILEKSTIPGGRMGDYRDGRFAHKTTGAHALGTQNPQMLELVDELGLRGELVERPNPPTTTVTSSGTVQLGSFGPAGFLTSSALSFRAKMRLALLIPDLMRARRKVDFNFIESAVCFDDETLTEYLTRKVGKDFLEEVIGPLFRTIWAWNSEEVSKAYFLMLAGAGGIGKTYTFKSGIGALSRALAEKLNVQYGCLVHSVEPDADGYHQLISYSDGERDMSMRADVVVCALPGNQVAAIFKGQADWERTFFSNVPYAQYAIVEYILKCAPRHKIDGMKFFARNCTTPLAGIRTANGSMDDPDVPGMAMAVLAPERLPHHVAQDGSNLDEVARRYLDEFYPGFSDDVAEAHPMFDGYTIPIFPVGQAKRIKDFLASQESGPKSIYYVGDYLTNATTGGATALGFRTAHNIARDWGRE